MEKNKKQLGLLSICLTLVLLVIGGCSAQQGTSSSGMQRQSIIECSYPDAPEIAAPTWICDEPIPGWQVSAVGSAKSKAGQSIAKEIATAQARDELAKSMRVHVKNMVKRFVRETGSGEQGSVDAMSEVVSRQVTKETLFGSRIIKSRTSPSKVVYVAVGLDTQRVVENAKKAINKARSSMKNAEAQYQTLEAEKSLKELDKHAAEINSKLPPTTKGEE